jgi:hypothetical protein
MAPTFDCVTIEKASGTVAVDPDFAALNPGYFSMSCRKRYNSNVAVSNLRPHRRRGVHVGRLLRLDVGGLDDRPPFVDFRRVKGAQTFRRLLLARRNFNAEPGEACPHGRVA